MMHGKELQNLAKLVKILRIHPGGLWVRELARQGSLHMETVRRLIKKHPCIFMEYADFTSYKINLKIIKLKDRNITENNIADYLKAAKKQGTLVHG